MTGSSIDFATMRRRMVDGQIRTMNVTDLGVLQAILDVPREHFLPEGLRGQAYLDRELPVGPAEAGRYLPRAGLLASLVQEAAIAASDRVLVVGCGTGYAVAVVSHLAKHVVGLESDAALAEQAKSILSANGCRNVEIVTGPLPQGAQQQAPFDVILMGGATEVEPRTLFAQLAPLGRLLGVFGTTPKRATLVQHTNDDYGSRVLFDASAPVLPEFVRPREFVF